MNTSWILNRGILLWAGFCVVGSLNLAAQPRFAQVMFQNHVPGILDAPVYDVDGITPLSGTQYIVELYGGPTPERMELTKGEPVYLGTGPGAGYFQSVNYARALLNVRAGDPAYLQIKVWDATRYDNYESAVAGNGMTGKSEIFPIITGGGGRPPELPPPLVGLMSFIVTSRAHILTEFRSVTIIAGYDANLSTSFTGVPDSAQLQWQYEVGPDAWADVEGATGLRLLLPRVASDQAGRYRLTMTSDNWTEVITKVTLKVITPPVMSRSQGDVKVTPGRFQISQKGVPGDVYLLQSSTDLVQWKDRGMFTNQTGTVVIQDSAAVETFKFYRLRVMN